MVQTGTHEILVSRLDRQRAPIELAQERDLLGTETCSRPLIQYSVMGPDTSPLPYSNFASHSVMRAAPILGAIRWKSHSTDGLSAEMTV